MSLPRYPEYTDSGVAWLGKVPAHWATHPIKHAIAKIESGVSVNAVDEPAESGGIGVLKTSCVYTGAFNPTENKAVVAEELSRVACPVRAGTLIVSRMNTPALVGAAGFVTESRDDLFLPDRLWQVHFREVANPAFVHYWTASPMYRAQVEMACAGTSASMQNLSQDAFLAFTLPLPLPSEQTAIATFLDRETGKIDALIAEQEKLLALLAEKRQATISHAVTKGLNPNVPLKDSGVAWLEQVPAHWEIRSITKATTKITNGYVGPTRDILIANGIPYVQATHIKGGRVNFGQDYFVSEEWSKAHAKSILGEGDVLIVQTGAGTGDVGLVSSGESGFNCHALIILSSNKSILHGPYLAAILQSAYGRAKLASIQTGAMHPHLNCGEVKFVEIPLPPLTEQIEIMDFLMSVTNRFDALTAEASQGIALLKERRSALIAAAVTGQIDVRGIVTEPEAA